MKYLPNILKEFWSFSSSSTLEFLNTPASPPWNTALQACSLIPLSDTLTYYTLCAHIIMCNIQYCILYIKVWVNYYFCPWRAFVVIYTSTNADIGLMQLLVCFTFRYNTVSPWMITGTFIWNFNLQVHLHCRTQKHDFSECRRDITLSCKHIRTERKNDQHYIVLFRCFCFLLTVPFLFSVLFGMCAERRKMVQMHVKIEIPSCFKLVLDWVNTLSGVSLLQI